MLNRLKSGLKFSNGEKAYAAAYAIVMAVSAGLTVFVMAAVDGDMALPSDATFYSIWTVIAGILGGALALYSARGWLGLPGALGWARAVVGAIAAALIAAVIAGTLIMPIYGTFYAPVMLATKFVELPLLAVGWFATILGAHHLMTRLTNERAMGFAEQEERSDLTANLSMLSRVNLYHRSD